MINRFIGVGRLTKDPNFVEGQTAIANFTIACNRPFKNKTVNMMQTSSML